MKKTLLILLCTLSLFGTDRNMSTLDKIKEKLMLSKPLSFDELDLAIKNELNIDDVNLSKAGMYYSLNGLRGLPTEFSLSEINLLFKYSNDEYLKSINFTKWISQVNGLKEKLEDIDSFYFEIRTEWDVSNVKDMSVFFF